MFKFLTDSEIAQIHYLFFRFSVLKILIVLVATEIFFILRDYVSWSDRSFTAGDVEDELSIVLCAKMQYSNSKVLQNYFI
jgi:hypothetical protein